MIGYFLSYAAFALAIILLWQVARWWVGALVAGVLSTGGLRYYERKYAEAAQATEVAYGIVEPTTV